MLYQVIDNFNLSKINSKNFSRWLGNMFYLPASEASREVENLTERKHPHTPYMVSNFMHKIDLSSNQNRKPIKKKFAHLAPRVVFVSSFLFQKQLIYDFLTENKC